MRGGVYCKILRALSKYFPLLILSWFRCGINTKKFQLANKFFFICRLIKAMKWSVKKLNLIEELSEWKKIFSINWFKVYWNMKNYSNMETGYINEGEEKSIFEMHKFKQITYWIKIKSMVIFEKLVFHLLQKNICLCGRRNFVAIKRTKHLRDDNMNKYWLNNITTSIRSKCCF